MPCHHHVCNVFIIYILLAKAERTIEQGQRIRKTDAPTRIRTLVIGLSSQVFYHWATIEYAIGAYQVRFPENWSKLGVPAIV